MLFLNENNYAFGLDISDLTLKLIQLSKTKKGAKIQALGLANLKKGTIQNGEIINAEEFLTSLRDLLKNPQFGKIDSNKVVASLPETKTFVKLATIHKSPNDLKNVIIKEVESDFPLAIEDVYYDWQIIKNYSDKMLVLISAAPKKIVDQYTEILAGAGLDLVALEVEPAAICRAILPEVDSKTTTKNYIVLDLGATRTGLTVYGQGSVIFTFSLPISGEKITSDVATSLKITKEIAEKSKLLYNVSKKDEDVIKEIINNQLQDLTKRIYDAIEFYNQYFDAAGNINEIILTGGGSNIKTITADLKKTTNIKTTCGNLLTNIKNETTENINKIMSDLYANKKYYKSNGLEFSTAVGLALRGLNNE